MSYLNHISKALITNLYDYRKELILKRKINRIFSHVKSNNNIHINSNLISKHVSKWKILNKKVNIKWLESFIKISGVQDVNYIPENIYYNQVEPILNNKMLTLAYSDKNFYDLYYMKNIFPEIIIRNMEGVFYTDDYKLVKDPISILENNNKIIVKPAIDSGGGKDVQLFQKKGSQFFSPLNEILNLEFLKEKYYRNYVIQNYVEQHDFYKKFNESSLNTIRVLTYRSVKTEEVKILHSILRIGKKGAIVDNQASGGISCGIRADGQLNDFAVDKLGHRFSTYNEVVFGDVGKVIKYEEILAIAKEVAAKNYYQRLLGFDFCVDHTGKVILIEVNNSNNEINFFQMNNGPLFVEYTDEIIEYCTLHPKTVCLDFTI